MRFLNYMKFFVLVAGIAGCTTNQLHFNEFTKNDRISVLKDEKFKLLDKPIDIQKFALRPRSDSPREFSDFVWHHGWEYKETFGRLPVENLDEFFSEIISRRIKSEGGSKTKITVKIQGVFLKTWAYEKINYRACRITIYVKANEQEVIQSSDIKLNDAKVFVGKENYSFFKSTANLYFDPRGLDVIEYAFLDAFKKALITLSSKLKNKS